MNTSEVLGLFLLLFGFGIRLGSSLLYKLLKLEDLGLSINALKLSGSIATFAGFVFFFFLNF